jgi:heme-binding NEAT domain protein
MQAASRICTHKGATNKQTNKQTNTQTNKQTNKQTSTTDPYLARIVVVRQGAGATFCLRGRQRVCASVNARNNLKNEAALLLLHPEGLSPELAHYSTLNSSRSRTAERWTNES